MNRSTIRTQIRDMLNAPGTGFYSDAFINSKITEANHSFNVTLASLSGEDFVLTMARRPTVANVRSYTIPSDLLILKRLEIMENATSEIVKSRITPFEFDSEMGQHNTPGRPQHFHFRKSQIDLYPIPDVVYNLRMWFDKSELPLSLDTDSPTIEEEFHRGIMYLGAYFTSLRNPELVREDFRREAEIVREEMITVLGARSLFGRGASTESKVIMGAFEGRTGLGYGYGGMY